MTEAREIRQRIGGPLANNFVRISIIGIFAILALLVGPLDSIADGNLTVHMFQHIGLFIGGIVFGYGFERYLSMHLAELRRKFSVGYSILLSIIKFNTRTKGLIFAVLIPAVVFIFWHYPPNFDLAVTNESVHAIEHFTYIFSGSLVGLSIIAIPYRLRGVLVAIGFMQAGMMGSMMTLGVSFFTVYSPAQNTQMGLSIMLFGAAGLVIISSWLLKVLDII